MRYLITGLMWICLSVCFAQEGKKMNTPLPTEKLQALFAQTKPVCFGRFVLNLPLETKVIWGPQVFGATIDSYALQEKDIFELAEQKVKAIEAIKGALIKEKIVEPNRRITLIFREDKFDIYGEDLWTYFKSQPYGFIFKSSASNLKEDHSPLDGEKQKAAYISTHLRSRSPEEVLTEPGVCIDHGFIADDSGQYQEIFGIGLRFPSLPDVTFSISSNKDAKHDDNESFSARRRQAEKEVRGTSLEAEWHKVKVLREGKHPLAPWAPEEALFHRPGEKGAYYHEFQIENAGHQTMHDPNWEAVMYTGVKGNRTQEVPSSLTDEEAIALWDKLLSSLRLRVAK